MGQKITIAVIGALTSLGSSVAKSLTIKYRLLLVDKNETELINLKAGLKIINSNSEVELFTCPKEACWEADIIILAANLYEQSLLASDFNEVAACKTVISIAISNTNYQELKSILSNSKVVNVLVNSEINTHRNVLVNIDGDYGEVDEIINEILINTN